MIAVFRKIHMMLRSRPSWGMIAHGTENQLSSDLVKPIQSSHGVRSCPGTDTGRGLGLFCGDISSWIQVLEHKPGQDFSYTERINASQAKAIAFVCDCFLYLDNTY